MRETYYIEVTDTFIDKNGKEWRLRQDGDCFAVCPDLMDNDTYQDFFGEIKPAPDDSYEYEVCECCLIALANDDYSGMHDAEEKATRRGLAKLESEYRMVVPDGAEYGFRHYRCECCGALPGDRYRVICLDKRGE